MQCRKHTPFFARARIATFTSVCFKRNDWNHLTQVVNYFPSNYVTCLPSCPQVLVKYSYSLCAE